MNKAVLAEDWKEAAVQMLDSKAARQTKDRYPKLAGALEHDDESYLKLGHLYDTPENEAIETEPLRIKAESEIAKLQDHIDAHFATVNEKLDTLLMAIQARNDRK